MAIKKKPIEIVEEGKHPLLTKKEKWGRIFLSEVAKVQNGYAFSSKRFTKGDGMPLIRIRDIDDLDTENYYNGEFSEDYVVKTGDVLIGMDGDFKVARWKGKDALLNQRVCRLKFNSNVFDEKFLFLCLQPYLDAIHEETSAVTVKHLSSRTIEEIPLPFPPLNEQQQIVSKIEELFSELDKSIEQLKTTQQQLKVYRQSVLKWAFEGKLTNENVKDGELPKGWATEVLGNIAEMCLGKMLDKQKNKGVLRPYLRNISVRWGSFDLNNLEQMKFEENELERYSLKKGDLIICEGGEPGRCAIWNLNDNSMMIQKALHRVRVNDRTNVKYVYYFLFFGSLAGKLEKYFTGTTIKHLTGKELKKVELPLPSIKEQEQIVQEIESRLSVADKLEETITNSLQQAEVLRQCILKKAFEGKLIFKIDRTIKAL